MHTGSVFIFADGFDVYPDFGQNACFFASVDGVIDGFFDGSEQCFAWVIEAEQMSVLGEKFADGDFLLGLCHILCGGARLRDSDIEDGKTIELHTILP